MSTNLTSVCRSCGGAFAPKSWWHITCGAACSRAHDNAQRRIRGGRGGATTWRAQSKRARVAARVEAMLLMRESVSQSEATRSVVGAGFSADDARDGILAAHRSGRVQRRRRTDVGRRVEWVLIPGAEMEVSHV